MAARATSWLVAMGSRSGACFAGPLSGVGVAAHASFVAAGEQRARRHLRLVLAVTLRARRERDGGSGVLMFVAGWAHLGRGLPVGRVRCAGFGVTLGARARLRDPIFVGAVALDAVARAVHGDGRGVPLRGEVAPAAILGARNVVHTRWRLS